MRVLNLIIPTLALFAVSCAQTSSERAALSERPLTSDEATALKTACALPSGAPSSALEGTDLNAVEMRLPEMQVLGLMMTTRASNGKGATLRMFPPLPRGGIARRDYCESVSITGGEGVLPRGATTFLGLRLRPGLDIAQDYPSSWGVITGNQQVVNIPARRYLVVPKPEPAEREALLSLIKTNADTDEAGAVLTIGDQLFAPLSE